MTNTLGASCRTGTATSITLMATVHAFRDEPGVQRRESFFAVAATRRSGDVLDQNADHGVSEPAADALEAGSPKGEDGEKSRRITPRDGG